MHQLLQEMHVMDVSLELEFLILVKFNKFYFLKKLIKFLLNSTGSTMLSQLSQCANIYLLNTSYAGCANQLNVNCFSSSFISLLILILTLQIFIYLNFKEHRIRSATYKCSNNRGQNTLKILKVSVYLFICFRLVVIQVTVNL